MLHVGSSNSVVVECSIQILKRAKHPATTTLKLLWVILKIFYLALFTICKYSVKQVAKGKISLTKNIYCTQVLKKKKEKKKTVYIGLSTHL